MQTSQALKDVFGSNALEGFAQDTSAQDQNTANADTDTTDTTTGIEGESDHLRLEMELDPFKSLMQTVRSLVRSGLDDDLVKAYELTQSAIACGDYNYHPDSQSELEQKMDELRQTLSDRPELKQILGMYNDATFEPAQPAPLQSPSPELAPQAMAPPVPKSPWEM